MQANETVERRPRFSECVFDIGKDRGTLRLGVARRLELAGTIFGKHECGVDERSSFDDDSTRQPGCGSASIDLRRTAEADGDCAKTGAAIRIIAARSQRLDASFIAAV